MAPVFLLHPSQPVPLRRQRLSCSILWWTWSLALAVQVGASPTSVLFFGASVGMCGLGMVGVICSACFATSDKQLLTFAGLANRCTGAVKMSQATPKFNKQAPPTCCNTGTYFCECKFTHMCKWPSVLCMLEVGGSAVCFSCPVYPLFVPACMCTS